MSDADYPSLGFDPLPGNAATMRDLAADTGIFAARLLEMGSVLDDLRRGEQWTGEAAEAFTETLAHHLPGSLHEAGKAVHQLSGLLNEYADRFDGAQAGAAALEERASQARQAMTSAEAALEAAQRAQGLSGAPAFLAAEPPWSLPEAQSVNKASGELTDVLLEARDYRHRFDDSVADLASAIERLAALAPDPPHRNALLALAETFFETNPIGGAIKGAHWLLNRFPHVSHDVAEFLTGISAVAAAVAIPALFIPGVGEVVGLVALVSAGGAALVDTSLAVGHAKDEHGRPFVSGADLTLAWATTGLAAFGVGTVAGANAAARGTTFAKEVTRQFTRETFAEAGATLRTLTQVADELGAAGAAKWMERIAGKKALSMGTKESFWTAAGGGGAIIGPAFVSDDPLNVLGFKDMAKIGKIDPLPKAVMEDLHPGEPDLHLQRPPVLRAGSPPPKIRPVDPVSKPVMGR